MARAGSFTRWLTRSGIALSALGPLAAGCPGPEMPLDAATDPLADAPADAGPPDGGGDAGPPVPANVDHCDYETLPPTARAGGTVTAGPLTAGVAEGFMAGPVSATLGAYTARAEGFGAQGLFDARRQPGAGAWAPSTGVATPASSAH